MPHACHLGGVGSPCLIGAVLVGAYFGVCDTEECWTCQNMVLAAHTMGFHHAPALCIAPNGVGHDALCACLVQCTPGEQGPDWRWVLVCTAWLDHRPA